MLSDKTYRIRIKTKEEIEKILGAPYGSEKWEGKFKLGWVDSGSPHFGKTFEGVYIRNSGEVSIEDFLWHKDYYEVLSSDSDSDSDSSEELTSTNTNTNTNNLKEEEEVDMTQSYIKMPLTGHCYKWVDSGLSTMCDVECGRDTKEHTCDICSRQHGGESPCNRDNKVLKSISKSEYDVWAKVKIKSIWKSKGEVKAKSADSWDSLSRTWDKLHDRISVPSNFFVKPTLKHHIGIDFSGITQPDSTPTPTNSFNIHIHKSRKVSFK